MTSDSAHKKSFFAGLFGAGRAVAEKERLEAFLGAAPGFWCGWGPDGALVSASGLAEFLGVEKVTSLADIQDSLSPGDAASLDGLFARMGDTGLEFTLMAQNADGTKTWELTGRRVTTGEADYYNIIWFLDRTGEQQSLITAEERSEEAEAESARLESALDQIPFPLWMRDGHTRISWCNRTYAQVLEVSPATVIAEQRELPARPLRKSAAKLPGKALAQAALDEGRAHETVAHTILGGSRRLMSIAEIPLPGGNRTLGVARDITREEELETEQKRYMAAYKELLEQLGTAIGIFDADQKLEFYNSAFSQFWGLEEKYLNAQPKLGDVMEKLREIRRLPEQADFRRFKKSWLDMFTGLLEPHEDMLYLPDGRALRMLVVPHPMGGLMLTFEDVTGRLELESSYNTLVAVQKETLDNLAEGVAAFGGDGRIRLWNPAFARLWQLNPEDIDNQHISQLLEKMKKAFAEEDWVGAKKQLLSQAIDRNMQDGRMVLTDGCLIQYSTVPLPDGGVLVTHIDITDTVKVEKALREKNAALETAERLKIDFLANVSYQLRTPLNAIMGFTEILDKEYFGPLNERQHEYAAGMHEAGGRLLALIDDILDLSTIEAGYLDLERDAVAVSDILENIYTLTSDWARKESIEVKLSCPANTGAIYADQRRLRQVLLNLMRNAIAYTPERGKISLSAKRTDDKVYITVKDTGAGIPKSEQSRIFEPFERIPGTRKNTGGTERGAGLGLTLVKNIIELHGGKITVESEPGKGSAFIIAMPAADQEKEKKPAKAKAKA